MTFNELIARRQEQETPGESEHFVFHPWDSSLDIPDFNLAAATFLVSLLGIIAFWVTSEGEFAFDDTEAILTNKDVTGQSPWTAAFFHDFWGNDITKNTSHKSYRPLTILTFRLTHYLNNAQSQEHVAHWYHLVNLFLHSINSGLVLLTYTAILKGLAPGQLGATRAGLLATSLFAVHPIHSENVAACVGRADLLASFFFLISFLHYARFTYSSRFSNNRQNKVARFRVSPALFISLLAAVLATFSKEQGITVLGVCVAYDLICILNLDPGGLIRSLPLLANFFYSHRSIPFSNLTKQNLLHFFFRTLSLVFTGAIILSIRWYIMGSSLPTIFQDYDNPAAFAPTIVERGINRAYNWAIHSWVTLCPWWLCFDWSMGCVPMICSLHDLRIIPTILFIITCLAFLLYSLFGCNTLLKRLTVFSVSLIVITFLPASNLLFTVGFAIGERQLYLPTIGSCLLLVVGAEFIVIRCQSRKITRLITYSFYGLILTWASMSILRSKDWLNESSLYVSGLRTCPLNAKIFYNIGKLHADTKNATVAYAYYQRSLELYPDYLQALNNMGNLLREKGDVQRSRQLLNRATTLDPTFAAAWMNYGITLATLGDNAAALSAYRTALSCRPNYPNCYYNMGNALRSLGKSSEAISAYNRAIQLKPSLSPAWINLAQLYKEREENEKWLSILFEGSRHNPDSAELESAFGAALGSAGRLVEAEEHLRRAIRLNPDDAKAYGNLGVVYHMNKKYRLAKDLYAKSLSLEPNQALVRDNLEKVDHLITTND